MSGSGIGNFVFAFVLQAIIDAHDSGKDCAVDGCDGWRAALRWEALAVFVLVATATVFLKVPSAGKRKPRASTAHFLKPRGACNDPRPTLEGTPRTTALLSEEQSTVLIPAQAPEQSAAVAVAAAAQEGVQLETDMLPLWTLVMTPCARSLCMYFFFGAFGYGNLYIHLVPSARDNGVSSNQAALLLASVGVSSTLGRLVLGTAADRIGRVAMLKLSMLVMGSVSAAWPAASGFGGFMAIACIYG